MFAEIALLQRFSVYLGHPIYSLSVCLFSLILASGLGPKGCLLPRNELENDDAGQCQKIRRRTAVATRLPCVKPPTWLVW